MILYRGTPVPERAPRPREYAAVFFAKSKAYAASYGPWVQTYEVGNPVILRGESRDAQRIVSDFLGERAGKLDIEDVLFHPTRELRRFLMDLGYTGGSVGENIGLYDLRGIRLLDREEVVYYPGTGRFKVIG